MSISRIFDISRRSMAAYQRALDATAHNIANASNPNYSRQRVSFSTEPPEILGGFIWGTGVKIDEILRVRDQLTDSQLRINNHKFYENSQRSSINGQIEVLFSEPSDTGISSLMESFFSSWNELSVTPNSSSLRNDVIHSAQQLASKVQSVYEGLDTIKGDLISDATSKVNELNSLLRKVQTLNARIFEQTTLGYSANDLMDTRDAAIDQISQLVNVNVTYDSSGSAVLSIGGAFAADKSNVIEFKLSDVGGNLTLTTLEGNIASLNGGELFALTDTYSKQLPKYQDKLDQLMNTLVDSVNSIHMTGYSLNPAETGIKFFEGYSNGVLKINDEILNDPNRIAVSGDGTEGNGDIAVLIAELSGKKLINGQTLGENYSGLVSDIGNSKMSADQMAESTALVIQQLEMQKASVSGVSIDEEMTNVLRFQRSYDASAKLIKVADEMLETLLTLV